ncbi:thiolase [Virgibacillus sp. MSP4-1]|uniref:thiolase C-terminal domain-containing protein n=1 Tax=Virgibacillus sp. MSP4-1 TaxID=2700081 RepID=UPI0003A8DFE3|nr:thiolase [Virgibacillus sp. MSP4-1]QHS23427.1 thiolase [Virgibacillus sp. MSP4-1]
MGKIKDRYAIVGVGESERSKKSETTPLHMALDAARIAIEDAGLEAKDIDGFMSYNENDSCTSHQLATYLGVRPKYVKDILGGGSSTEMLISDAISLIEAGELNTVLIFRSMNGRSGSRMGGGGWDPDMLQTAFEGGSYIIPYGAASPGQWFGLFATRHMYETGISQEHLGHVCVSFYEHAQRNPNAFFHGRPLDMEEYMNTPYLSYPFTKHDFCLESDEANAIIVTSAERARDCKSKPVYIMGLSSRQCHPHAHYWSDITQVASDYVAPEVYQSAGVKPEDIHVASIYDCFSWVVLRQLEAFGFAPRGEVGDFVADGNLRLDGKLPTNTAGGMLSEGYTHGMNNVLEIVRQIRHEYEGTDRQVKDCEIGICTGWAGPDIAGAMILRNE